MRSGATVDPAVEYQPPPPPQSMPLSLSSPHGMVSSRPSSEPMLPEVGNRSPTDGTPPLPVLPAMPVLPAIPVAPPGALPALPPAAPAVPVVPPRPDDPP